MMHGKNYTAHFLATTSYCALFGIKWINILCITFTDAIGPDQVIFRLISILLGYIATLQQQEKTLT